MRAMRRSLLLLFLIMVVSSWGTGCLHGGWKKRVRAERLMQEQLHKAPIGPAEGRVRFLSAESESMLLLEVDYSGPCAHMTERQYRLEGYMEQELDPTGW